MGPQPFGCGRYVVLSGALRACIMLQWGRNLSVAEGTSASFCQPDLRTLQWGRNLSVAEGGSSATGRLGIERLQWGRNLSVAEGW